MSRPTVVALVAVLALCGVASVVAFVLVWSSAGPDHPDAWHPAVAELAAFVEDERRVPFEHPVHVNLLSAEQYRAEVTSAGPVDVDDPAPADEAGFYRALGLLEGSPDLVQASEQLWAEGTAAYYDGETEQIYVNTGAETLDGSADQLPVELRVVVVHELAHALQHQVLDPDVLAGWDDDSEAYAARLAVIEGDATLVEQAYVDTLDDASYDELLGADMESFERMEAASDPSVPELWPLLFDLPYRFGPAWSALELDRAGAKGVFLAMSDDLPTTRDLLGLVTDPSERARPSEVEPPASRDGDEELWSDRFGVFGWLVPLAAYGDPAALADTLAGWNGDAMRLVRDRSDRVCVLATVALVDDAAAQRFADAVQRWFEQLPADADADSVRTGRSIELVTCDPGPDARIEAPNDTASVLGVLEVRNDVVASLVVWEGQTLDAARCYADELVERFGDRLSTDEQLYDSTEFMDVATELSERCELS